MFDRMVLATISVISMPAKTYGKNPEAMCFYLLGCLACINVYVGATRYCYDNVVVSSGLESLLIRHCRRWRLVTGTYSCLYLRAFQRRYRPRMRLSKSPRIRNRSRVLINKDWRMSIHATRVIDLPASITINTATIDTCILDNASVSVCMYVLGSCTSRPSARGPGRPAAHGPGRARLLWYFAGRAVCGPETGKPGPGPGW